MSALQAVAAPAPNDASELDREALAGLCHFDTGITKTIRRHGQEHRFRAAACTGALYHVDLYPVCGDLRDIDAGVYHYDPRTDSLELLRDGDYRGALVEASREPAVERAPVTFVTTSTWWRNARKYEARTYRHAFWDSGTVTSTTPTPANSSCYTPANTGRRPDGRRSVSSSERTPRFASISRPTSRT